MLRTSSIALAIFAMCLLPRLSAAAPFETYIEAKQVLTTLNGNPQDATTAYWSASTVPAMYQNWDGSSFTITTRMTVPTAAQLASGSNFRGAGIFLQDSVNSLDDPTADLHRYIIGLTPDHFGRTDHRGKGLLRWETGGGMTNGGTSNLNPVTTTYFDVRVAFDSVTKVLDVDVRNEGEANYSDLLTHQAPASFTPDDVGLSLFTWKADAGPWAPDAGQQIQFDYFNISGGTGAAVSDNFDDAAFTASKWQYHVGVQPLQTEGGLTNSTTWTQVVPEPVAGGLVLMLGTLAMGRRRRA